MVGSNYNYKLSLLSLGKSVLRDNMIAVHESPTRLDIIDHGRRFIPHGSMNAKQSHTHTTLQQAL